MHTEKFKFISVHTSLLIFIDWRHLCSGTKNVRSTPEDSLFLLSVSIIFSNDRVRICQHIALIKSNTLSNLLLCCIQSEGKDASIFGTQVIEHVVIVLMLWFRGLRGERNLPGPVRGIFQSPSMFPKWHSLLVTHPRPPTSLGFHGHFLFW